MARKHDSQFVTTFEIRRNAYPILRIEQDSKRHGSGELCVTFFRPDGEVTQRMTAEALELAILEARAKR